MTTPPSPTHNDQDHAGVLAFPPYIHLGSLAIALPFEFLWPSDLFSFVWQIVIFLALAGLAGILGRWAAPELRKKGTTLDVRTPSTALVTAGAYQYSRNPIYLGMALIHLAIGALVDSVWILLAVIPAMLIMTYGVIKREEAYLERLFGEEYLTYKTQVRRWI